SGGGHPRRCAPPPRRQYFGGREGGRDRPQDLPPADQQALAQVVSRAAAGRRTRHQMLIAKTAAPRSWPRPPTVIAIRRPGEGTNPPMISALALSAVAIVSSQYTVVASAG